jgi:hypothetical protein
LIVERVFGKIGAAALPGPVERKVILEVPGSNNSSGPLASLKSAQADVGASQLRLLEAIAECERDGTWLADGCRDFAHWISAQLGISNWSARRWLAAAEALPRLTLVRDALGSGALSIDKVLELTRYATPDTEHRLISWAKRVTPRNDQARG